MNTAILLKTDDWEMLYVNGELKEEGRTLNQGFPWIRYFLDLAKKYNFDIREMEEITMNKIDSHILQETGMARKSISEYSGNYAD